MLQPLQCRCRELILPGLRTPSEVYIEMLGPSAKRRRLGLDETFQPKIAIHRAFGTPSCQTDETFLPCQLMSILSTSAGWTKK